VRVRHLSLVDFRSYSTAEVPIDPGPSVFVGPNGQGKTNLMEAIGYVATLGSHRVGTDAPMVRSGAARAVIRTAIVRDDRELVAELEIVPGRPNRAKLNRTQVRPREVLGALRMVMFAPEDLALVRGDPSERRRYLDELLVARTPRYSGVRADYERVLKQRNALLKTAGMARRSGSAGDLRTLDVWDNHLAVHGAELLAGRLELITALQPFVVKGYDSVSMGSGPAITTYKCSALDEGERAEDLTPEKEVLTARLLAALARARQSEVERGITLVGPHRDDLVLQLGDLPAKGYASHGESWSYALALKLAAYDLLCSDGGQPMLVLDDVFAELDGGRRDRLADLVAPAEQVLVTAAVPGDVPENLQGARYDVAGGEVRRVR
jgi:DNA replication and repair protein RecF